MLVKYNSMLNFLLASVSPLHTVVMDRELTFSFSEYIKCELDTVALTELYPDRTQQEYVNAYKFTELGDSEKSKDCSKVLRYFYRDLCGLFVNVIRQCPDLNTDIKIDTQVLHKRTPFSNHIECLEIGKIKQDLGIMLSKESKVENLDPLVTSVVLNFDYEELQKLIPTNLLSLVAALTHLSSDSTPLCRPLKMGGF